MADLSVKRLTQEEMTELREQYARDCTPYAELIREFQVVDDHGTVIDYFDTEQEARSVLDDLTKRSLVEDAFRDWAQKTAEEVGIPREEVVEIAKDLPAHNAAGGMKIIWDVWFQSRLGLAGIVVGVEENTGERKACVGVAGGFAQRADQEEIARCGVKLSLATLDEIRGHLADEAGGSGGNG